jgi:HNH endonuclease
MRICGRCGKSHPHDSSPICSGCRARGSKRPCPMPGCERMIWPWSKACRRHAKRSDGCEPLNNCVECTALLKIGERRVCATCRGLFVLCACGCGRYRRKYGKNGFAHEFISGHNDNWAGKRRPHVTCLVCKRDFQATTTRQQLCGLECRAEWGRWNGPKRHKRVKVACAACGTIILRHAYEIKAGREFACSKTCRYKILSKKFKGRISMPKRLAAARDGYKCKVCGFSTVIEVHHILPRKRNGGGGTDILTNLITLCPNHHTMADRGLLSATELQALIAT